MRDFGNVVERPHASDDSDGGRVIARLSSLGAARGAGMSSASRLTVEYFSSVRAVVET